MSRIALIMFAAAAGCASGNGSRSEVACVKWPSAARPLLVGDTMRLSTGTLYDGSDCDPPPPERVFWASEQPAVASVDSEGLVRGLIPGRFTAVGIAGDDTLHAKGFVLPPGWTARLTPASVTVRVGDSVSFMITALDSLGGQLPSVPYSLYTPEWQNLGSSDTAGKAIPPRLTTEHAFADVTTPSVFHMEKAGTTLLIGQIGDRHLTATLVVLPAATPRP